MAFHDRPFRFKYSHLLFLNRYAENGFGDNAVLPERLDALAKGGVNVYIRNYLICRMFHKFAVDFHVYVRWVLESFESLFWFWLSFTCLFFGCSAVMPAAIV